jgi:hypothetical protein
MSKLEGFNAAPVYERLPDFEVGTYVAEVVELARFDGQDGEFFKARFRILQASPGSGSAPGDEVCSLIGLFGKYKTSQFGRAKNIVGACTRERGSKISESDFDEALAADNPCAGAKVKVYATPGMGKDSGKPYAKCTFVPYNPPVAMAESPTT